MARDSQGMSLLELLLSLTITITVVVTLSLIFPKINKSIVINQSRSTANNLAANTMQNLKKMPYDLLDVTAATEFHMLTVNCNCQTDDFSGMASTFTVLSGKSYEVQTCVNYISRVSNVWTSQCPSAGSTGNKYITVRVRWVLGNETYTVSQEHSKIQF